MKFTLSWLKEHLETSASLEEICGKLTSIGLEVESVNNFAETLKPFTVAEIIEVAKHPQADKLSLCKVNTGMETLEIVCGAPNARPGIKVAFARIGTVIPAGGMEIKKTKIRGVESNGMLCSASELGISEESEGILELPEIALVGTPFAPYMGLDDAVIEIAITPNRGDCLGVHNIARDLAASGIGTLKKPAYHLFRHQGKPPNPVNVTIENGDGCNWFIGVYIEDVRNKQSPDWLRKKLEAVGKRSISALVDITNYLTLTYGRPAHIYDAGKLNGNITVRNAKKGEKLLALDNKEYQLDESILIIADSKKPIAIAGVIGGIETGCTLDTKDAYLEFAHFSPDVVARSGRRLQIDSDARYRFERNVDYASSGLLSAAIKIISDICGGTSSKEVVAGNIGYTQREVEFWPEIIEKVTGIHPDTKTLDSILNDLGFSRHGNKLKIPSWRNDISIAEDIAEEYARLVGYDKIPVKYLQKPHKTTAALTPAQKKISQSRRILAGRGMNEVVTFSFMSGTKAKLFTENGKLKTENSLIEIANPISADLGVMRPSMIPNLLDAAASNQARGRKSFSFFEVGGIFSKDKEFVQAQCVAGIRCGIENEKSPLDKEKGFDLFTTKADVLSIFSGYFDTSKLNVEKNTRFSYYHPGRSGVYKLGPNIIAVFGEIHPGIRKKFDLKQDACAFEIFTDRLPHPGEKKEYTRKAFEVSNFQPVERDFAFIVDSSVLAQDILTAVRRSERSISEGVIEEVRIFDIYEGDKLGAGKKSIAFNVRIQPKAATLTDEQIEQATSKIVESVRVATGGTLRDS